MLDWDSLREWYWDLDLDFGEWILILLGSYVIFSIYDHQIRHRTLRQSVDGTYVWRDWRFGQRSSQEDPSKPGGEWVGDGSGGDGGGDGGGGGGD